jgi:hypothetical protein
MLPASHRQKSRIGPAGGSGRIPRLKNGYGAWMCAQKCEMTL